MKPTLPPGYLDKKYRKLNLEQLVTLAANVVYAARDQGVGFEDANHTLETYLKELGRGKQVWISQGVLESALWSCNLLGERDKFWSMRDQSFEDFVKTLLYASEEFDFDYNYIKKKGESNEE